ncbi:small VCP/p97-interacting protein isoform X2 [Stigmatopora argus]
MGMCLPCFGGAVDDAVDTPDPDSRRRQLAEAAEKRQKERSHMISRKRHTKAATRQHTGVSKTQKRLRGKEKSKKKLRIRR